MSYKEEQKYNVIGLMSGTSLDGVDIVFCTLQTNNNGAWEYKIMSAETIPYTTEWKQRLVNSQQSDALTFCKTHTDYGFYLGELVTSFIAKHNAKPDFIASHGHTIFHQPQKRLTVQIGAGNAIAAQTELPVICDFRSTDVALGGQGAPLVPIGDKLLFAEYDFCLNLGGFANVSYQHNGERIAFDICPVNIVMNAVCSRIGKEYDHNGELASQGSIHETLLNELNKLLFYHIPPNTPKSLGKEWVLENIFPLIEKYKLPESTILRTFCEHIAIQTAKSLEQKNKGKLLVTGGGAYNSFLLNIIQRYTAHELIVPDKSTIEFKEALIFAFLGVLRMRNENNCLKSVTGAKRDNCGGTIYSA